MYNNCKKVSLPTYEFMKTKYWIEGKQQVNLNNIFYKKINLKFCITLSLLFTILSLIFYLLLAPI